MDNFNEVYNILSNIECFDIREYNKLARKYDKEQNKNFLIIVVQ